MSGTEDLNLALVLGLGLTACLDLTFGWALVGVNGVGCVGAVWPKVSLLIPNQIANKMQHMVGTAAADANNRVVKKKC